jgi:hypothetical protein
MTPDRIKCIWCDAMILPSTADRNGGRCGRCVKINEAQHRAQLAYEARIAAGFAPTSEELRSAKTSDELFGSGAQWKLQPEYYAEEESSNTRPSTARTRGLRGQKKTSPPKFHPKRTSLKRVRAAE